MTTDTTLASESDDTGMTLRERLASIPPREGVGGPTGAGRFDYQLNWALVKILSLHETSEDYLVLLDFHDDVVVCDSALDPEAAEFYQIKTRRSGTFTLGAILKREPNSLSYVGKLYDHVLKFADSVRSLCLVTTVPVRVRLATGEDSRTCEVIACGTLDAIDMSKIQQALREEHALDHEPDIATLRFEVSPIPLASYETHVKGLLVDYIDARLHGAPYRARLIYNGIIAELRRKNNVERPPQDFVELARIKGVSRDEFEAVLSRATAAPDPNAEWRSIEQRLDRSGVPPMTVRRLKGEYFRNESELVSRKSLELGRAFEWVQGALTTLHDSDASLQALLATVLDLFRYNSFNQALYSDDKITVLTLMALQRQ